MIIKSAQCGNPQCSEMFTPQRPGQKYHNRQCYWDSKRGQPSTNPKKRITKKCENPNCKETFETGGRAGKIDQKYHSHKCALEASVKHSPPKTLSAVEAAQLAGFFDGEGSIVRVKQNGNAWRITIYQNHEPMIRWIQNVTGTGYVGSHLSKGTNLVKRPIPKRQWYWNLYGRNAAVLLKQLLPYLIVKKDKAIELLTSLQVNVED